MKDTCLLIVKEFSVSTVSANCSALYLSSYRFSLTSFFDLMKSAVEAEEKLIRYRRWEVISWTIQLYPVFIGSSLLSFLPTTFALFVLLCFLILLIS